MSSFLARTSSAKQVTWSKRPSAPGAAPIRKLGIFEQMHPRIVRARGGAGAMALLAKGEVEIGLTFLSEIHDPAVEIVGPLPREISTPTALVGFVSTRAKAPEAAKDRQSRRAPRQANR